MHDLTSKAPGAAIRGELPARPAEGAARARAHLEYRGAHRAPAPAGPRWVKDQATLRRVRDALASGLRR